MSKLQYPPRKRWVPDASAYRRAACPCVSALDDADLDLAVNGVVAGGFGSTGQRCTATSRAIVTDKVYDDFLGRLVAARVFDSHRVRNRGGSCRILPDFR